MLKTTFFQVFSSTCAAAAFLMEPKTTTDSRRWYSLGGALVFNILFFDMAFIQVILDLVRPEVIIQRLYARRAVTQLQMNQRYYAPAGIYISFRCMLAGKFVLLAAMFGSAMPILYLIATCYFW